MPFKFLVQQIASQHQRSFFFFQINPVSDFGDGSGRNDIFQPILAGMVAGLGYYLHPIAILQFIF